MRSILKIIIQTYKDCFNFRSYTNRKSFFISIIFFLTAFYVIGQNNNNSVEKCLYSLAGTSDEGYENNRKLLFDDKCSWQVKVFTDLRQNDYEKATVWFLAPNDEDLKRAKADIIEYPDLVSYKFLPFGRAIYYLCR